MSVYFIYLPVPSMLCDVFNNNAWSLSLRLQCQLIQGVSNPYGHTMLEQYCHYKKRSTANVRQTCHATDYRQTRGLVMFPFIVQCPQIYWLSCIVHRHRVCPLWMPEVALWTTSPPPTLWATNVSVGTKKVSLVHHHGMVNGQYPLVVHHAAWWSTR